MDKILDKHTGLLNDDFKLRCGQGSAPCEVNSHKCTDGVLDKNGVVCCKADCGSCGGPHCAARQGGAPGCCGGSITAQCRTSAGPPPCRYPQGPAALLKS